MKILNLFAGIGGNRTLWGNEHKITAVEHNQQIAMIYHKRFPEDEVIIGDAYRFLELYYKEYDFIWASPPCTTHTCLMFPKREKQLPDLRLYSLILFLKHHYHGIWVVENVHPYYKPIVPHTSIVGRHYIWSNLPIPPKHHKESLHLSFSNMNKDIDKVLYKKKINPKVLPKDRLLRKSIINNTIVPELGKYILDCIVNQKQKTILEFNYKH